MRRLREAAPRGDSAIHRAHHPRCLHSKCGIPIFYATLIVVMAVVPVFFMQALSGAFFKPLIFAYVTAILASLVVAVTITPVLCLLLLRNASLCRQGVAAGRVAGPSSTCACSPAPPARRARPTSPSAVVTLAGVATWPLLGHSLLPSFKERDFLMHWVTDPSTSHPGDAPHHQRGEPGTAFHPRCAQLRRAYRPGVPGRRDRRRRQRRELDQHRSQGRLRQDDCRHQGGGRRLSGPVSRPARPT